MQLLTARRVEERLEKVMNTSKYFEDKARLAL
jgi:hypothetical protein